VRHRAVFLEDYDLSLAREMVQGVDLWLNTPRRPMEACGTSGMKVLVNGGLNLSELDGWWAEAFCEECGWALGDGREHTEADWDLREAEELFRLLEEQVVPAFYERDSSGIPRRWVGRVRSSMARLATRFSSNRMLQEYVEGYYFPAAEALRQRTADGGRLARELGEWHRHVDRLWHEVHFARFEASVANGRLTAEAHVHLGELDSASVRVELCADPSGAKAVFRMPMERDGAIPGAMHASIYKLDVNVDRPADHFTARVVPWHPAARVPAEARQIRWQR
jgi:starch phosphorylase